RIVWFVAGETGEGIVNREMRLDAAVAQTVELALDVAGIIRRDAVDRFIDHAETHFGAGYWSAIGIARQDCVRRRLARLVLFLVRDNFEVEHLVTRGHNQTLVARVHIAAL